MRLLLVLNMEIADSFYMFLSFITFVLYVLILWFRDTLLLIMQRFIHFYL